MVTQSKYNKMNLTYFLELPPEKQCLKLEGIELEDEKTLDNYKIDSRTTVC